MAIFLNIQIVSEKIFKNKTINFSEAENWTCDAELQLLYNIHDLIEILRPYGKKLSLDLKVESNDAELITELIKRRQKKISDNTKQKLSQKEIQIVRLLMRGLSSSEIAELLFISYETVKSHRKNILMKTGAKNTAALINYYHKTFFEK